MKKIIIETLNHLYKIAYAQKNIEFHTKLIKKMVNLSQKYLIKIPIKIKRSYCKKCYTFCIPTVYCKTEIKIENKKTMCVITCRCGYIKRYTLN